MKKIKNLKNGKILYKNHRDEPYFSFVKKGVKTIEGRIKQDLYEKLELEDEILVFNNKETDKIRVIVKGLRTYSSFKEMLKKEDFKKILPNVDSIEEGVKIYRKFYTSEQEKEFGVIAIGVEVRKRQNPFSKIKS
ncbi:ASCH domain-containing protein [Candidatus Parcubacteria bacterium]|nr:ASCH domain-containing protein [Candidatus Parcubacteria bacterium]